VPGGFEDFSRRLPALANFAGYGIPMGIKPEDKHPQIVVASTASCASTTGPAEPS